MRVREGFHPLCRRNARSRARDPAATLFRAGLPRRPLPRCPQGWRRGDPHDCPPLTDRSLHQLESDAFRGFFDNLAVGGVQIGPDGRFLRVNRRLCELTGYSREALLRMRVGDLDHPDDAVADRERWSTFLADPSAEYDVEKRYVRADGSPIWVHVTAARVAQGADAPVIAKTVEDVTARVRAAEAQRESEARLREALAVKEEFLGMVSHELRTPLTLILGLANLMTRDGLEPDAMRETAAEIRESAEQLASLLESMLVLARVGRDEQQMSEPILVDRIVNQAVTRHRQVYPRRPVHVHADGAERTLVEGHEAWVLQVVANLLGNAEKYSPPDSPIEVDVAGEGQRVIVRVRDHGVGVAESEIPDLFEPFYRSPRTNGRTSGLGLGLAVCKQLVELQGGEVWGGPRGSSRGSEFGFWLPALDPDVDGDPSPLSFRVTRAEIRVPGATLPMALTEAEAGTA